MLELVVQIHGAESFGIETEQSGEKKRCSVYKVVIIKYLQKTRLQWKVDRREEFSKRFFSYRHSGILKYPSLDKYFHC